MSALGLAESPFPQEVMLTTDSTSRVLGRAILGYFDSHFPDAAAQPFSSGSDFVAWRKGNLTAFYEKVADETCAAGVRYLEYRRV
jgi:hypothetical protein